jgi:hypothetical protein
MSRCAGEKPTDICKICGGFSKVPLLNLVLLPLPKCPRQNVDFQIVTVKMSRINAPLPNLGRTTWPSPTPLRGHLTLAGCCQEGVNYNRHYQVGILTGGILEVDVLTGKHFDFGSVQTLEKHLYICTCIDCMAGVTVQ